jgi:hypothetical protein
MPAESGFELLQGNVVFVALCLPDCLESFVKRHSALGHVPIEGQSKEHLLRQAFLDKPGYVLEPELLVVLRMLHETTSLSVLGFQS